MAFSSLSDISTTLKIGNTITWSFTLGYIIATTSLWCWKKISRNDVTSVSIRNRSTSRWKPNKKPVSPLYRVPTGKKNDKQLVKNYRPISLLPICGKIFERLIYNKLFHFFQGNNLSSPSQCGFKPGDSCTNQLLAITMKYINHLTMDMK